MHIDIVPNRQSPPTVLLRESYRDGPHVRKRTLANLSALSAAQVDAMRRTLRGETLVPSPISLRSFTHVITAMSRPFAPRWHSWASSL